MAAIELHKVLVTDYAALLRAMYAEDLPLLEKFHQNAGQGLDACVASTLSQISPDSKFYKIEMPDGTLVGYFVVAEPQEGIDYMEGFFLRMDYRTPEIKQGFIDLINSTFSNNFFTSTGANNYRAISFLLKNNFRISNPNFVALNGKSFVVLEASNS